MKWLAWLAMFGLLGCGGSTPSPAEPVPVLIQDRDAGPTDVSDALVEPAPSRETKEQQCDRLIETINVKGIEIKEATAEMNAGGDDTALVANVGDVMDTVANAVARVPLADEALIAARNDYAQMLRAGAKAARAMAAAAKANDLPGLKKSMEAVSTMGTTEADLIERVNDYCAGGAQNTDGK
jgi:hypothetical protein